MVLTPFHLPLAFLLYYPFRKNLSLYAVLLASVLPDLEGLYYLAAKVIPSCEYSEWVVFKACWDSFETHFYSHSIIGVIAVGVAAALALKALKTSSLEFNSLALSGVFGAATHVFVDLFTHTTPDELKLLLPLPWKFGQLYHAAAYDALTFLSVAVAVWMLALWRKGVFTRRRFIEKQYP